MKRFIRSLIGCSIMLAVAAWAQQPEASSTPEKNKNKQQRAEETTPAQRQPGAKAREAQQNEGRRHEARKSQEPANEPQPNATAANAQVGREKKEARREHHANTSASPAASTAAEASAAPASSPEQAHRGTREMKNRAKTSAAAASATPAASATAAATAAAATTQQQNTRANATGKAKKIDQQQVQQIKQQHASFKAQAKPQQAPAVTFNQNYRIQEAQSWTGPQYEVFRSYRPERHDQGWYRSHYGRVELIGGGYYYFNNGYWYPAWGYNPSAEYYAYDGPIYVGHEAKPWDQVIADVQAELQQMGYYRGEVDGLLGPLTREALTAYQQDQGLIVTAAIDEPTLDSLGLS